MTSNELPCQGNCLGADGGHIANLGPLIAQVLGARARADTHSTRGANPRFRFEIDGAASTEIHRIRAARWQSRGIRLPYPLASRSPLPYMRLKINNYGITCDIAGRNGFFARSPTKADANLTASSRNLNPAHSWTAASIWIPALGGWLLLLWGATNMDSPRSAANDAHVRMVSGKLAGSVHHVDRHDGHDVSVGSAWFCAVSAEPEAQRRSENASFCRCLSRIVGSVQWRRLQRNGRCSRSVGCRQ